MTNTITLEIVCPVCGKMSYVTVDIDNYIAYVSGELVQKAFPDLSAVRREQILSGLCPSCQTEIFGECA